MFELYEVFKNGSTSHVGPFPGLLRAKKAARARIRGCRSLATVFLIPRRALAVHPDYAVAAVAAVRRAS